MPEIGLVRAVINRNLTNRALEETPRHFPPSLVQREYRGGFDDLVQVAQYNGFQRR